MSEPNTLMAIAALAWLLLKGKKASAATPTTPGTGTVPQGPAPVPTVPVENQKGEVVTVPEVLIVANQKLPPPPVSAQSVPWQQVQQQVLNRPQTQSTKREAIPAINVKRNDGSAPQNEMAAMIVRERNPLDSSYWMPATKLSPEEVAVAKARLTAWQKGWIGFEGPRTFKGRRQYRAVMQNGKKAIVVLQPKPPFS